jgi:hypothetical protein
MRKVLLALLFSLPVFAQDGFRGEKGNLVWERVIPVENANIVAILDAHPNLKVASFMENVYKGSSEETKITSTSGSALIKNNCKYDFLIMVNPDSYVVKVTNIKFVEKYGPMQTRIIANRAEKYFMNDTALRADDKSKTDLTSMDTYFSGMFSAGPAVSNEALTAK